MADGSGDPAVFSSSSLPVDPRLLATVTNAYLGTRVYRDALHVSGVYSGAAGDAHRADVPSPANVRMAVPGEGGLDETFALDTRTGKWWGRAGLSLSCCLPACLRRGHPLLFPPAAGASLLEVKASLPLPQGLISLLPILYSPAHVLLEPHWSKWEVPLYL